MLNWRGTEVNITINSKPGNSCFFVHNMAEAINIISSTICLNLLFIKILQLIFSHLKSIILAQHINLTCHFPTLTPHVYQCWYEKIYTHHILNESKFNWKSMALEKERYKSIKIIIQSLKEVTTEILNNFFLSTTLQYLRKWIWDDLQKQRLLSQIVEFSTIYLHSSLHFINSKLSYKFSTLMILSTQWSHSQ